MFQKVKPYMGSCIKYTYAALGVMFLALLIVAAVKGDMAFTVLSAVKLGAVLLFGAAGGILGVREKHA